MISIENQRSIAVGSWLIIALMLVSITFVHSKLNTKVNTKPNDSAINYHQVLFNYMKDDSNVNFKYTLLHSMDIPNTAKFFVFNMTSVKWLTEQEVGKSYEWYHYVEIVVPYQITQSKEALILISGGSQHSDYPKMDKELIEMGILTKSIVCTIHQIPNQPLVFSSDPLRKSRVEDAILAFAWARFMNQTSEIEWIPRQPMVKSSLMAMDLVQQFLKSSLKLNVEHFHVAGASKRGWTTNLVGVVDKRVKSIIPIVIPVWNTRDILEHTYNSLCKWPESMGDYVREGITNRLNSVEFQYLTQVIDPLEYNDILAGKFKYFVNAVGDQFFIPDLSQFSYPLLKGSDERKHLRYVPNADHSLAGSDAQLTIMTYYYCLINNISLPTYTFGVKYESGGHATVNVNVVKSILPLKSVLLWEAFAPNRDFRQEIIGNVWKSRDISSNYNSATGQLAISLTAPTNGQFYAAFVELTFDLGASLYLKFTTSVYILPDVLPCQYQ